MTRYYTCVDCGAEAVAGKTGPLPKRCSECAAAHKLEYNRQYHQDNREQIAEQKRQYYQDNREQKLERMRQYRQENREQIRQYRQENHEHYLQYHRQYYQDNREQILDRHRRYHENNREKELERNRQYRQDNREQRHQYYQDNREQIAERMRQYRQENRDIFRANYARRRARKNELPDDFTAEDIQHAVDYFNGCCAVCGRPLRDLFGTHTMAMDHWIPLSYDGDDNPGTVPGNMVPLCHGEDGCNNKKNGTLPGDWLRQVYSDHEAQKIEQRIQEFFLTARTPPTVKLQKHSD
jgi:hypothetical protein